MAMLEAIHCERCGRSLESDEFKPNCRGGATVARDYASCLRRCESCGIGYSNGRQNPTAILRDPIQNVPTEVRHGLLGTIENALNEVNRRSKLVKLGFSTSEDAVTWTVFQSLLRAGRISVIPERVFNQTKHSTLELLLWGVAQPQGDDNRNELRRRITEIAKDLGEQEHSLSEPDVVVTSEIGVVLIEAKYRSRNEFVAAGDRRWDRYLCHSLAFPRPKLIRESGLYELARNWRIGWELAKGKPLALVNLGPSDLFINQRSRLDTFRQGLRLTDDRQFVEWSWGDVIDMLGNPPDWLRSYCQLRRLCV